jgi:ribokinase
MHGKIVVIGSSNTDMVIKSDKFPLPGETILGGKFFMFPGGKGANQAVAAARLNGQVTFIARTGNDIFGKQAIGQFQKEGINTSFISTDSENPSGVALITVDGKGENTIVVAQGANGQLSEQDINKAIDTISEVDVVLVQLEIPIPTVAYAIKKSYDLGKKVILNPAPAQPISEEVLGCLYIITPNETEAEILTGIKVIDAASAARAAVELKRKGVQQVVITLGSKGAYIHTDSVSKLIAAPLVQAIDTTAAGDVFNGALAVATSEGFSIVSAVAFANAAAAISVTRMGAQASAPFRKEISVKDASV